jgi:phage shock protein A
MHAPQEQEPVPYFSRLTDIVTCSLTQILANAEDPRGTLSEIIREMQEGIAGAQRCMKTAGDNESRLRAEIDDQRGQTAKWVTTAREHLSAGNEDQARLALMRKHEVENLIAGLEMQLKAAAATREHLTTTFHALEARLADARRRLATLESGGDALDSPGEFVEGPSAAGRARRAPDVIDLELEALKQELQRK